MMKILMSTMAAACLSFSLSATAAPGAAGPSDVAIVSCKTVNLLVSAFSVSYDTAANPSLGCAGMLKALAAESMAVQSTTTNSDTVVYTLGYFSFPN